MSRPFSQTTSPPCHAPRAAAPFAYQTPRRAQQCSTGLLPTLDGQTAPGRGGRRRAPDCPAGSTCLLRPRPAGPRTPRPASSPAASRSEQGALTPAMRRQTRRSRPTTATRHPPAGAPRLPGRAPSRPLAVHHPTPSRGARGEEPAADEQHPDNDHDDRPEPDSASCQGESGERDRRDVVAVATTPVRREHDEPEQRRADRPRASPPRRGAPPRQGGGLRTRRRSSAARCGARRPPGKADPTAG